MEDTRQGFEEAYTNWIKSAAKDIAFSLDKLKSDKLQKIISRNEEYLEKPESIYSTQGLEKVKEFVPKDVLLLSTDAVVFSQSIFVRMPNVFDFAIALNRKYYIDDLWYSIITLNRCYLERATEVMIRYTIEHELLQKEVYEENMKKGGKKFTPEEKRKISNETRLQAIEKTGITKQEAEKEERLMLEISSISPLIPKPFAEAGLYYFIKKNKEEFKDFAKNSRNDKEKEIGNKLNSSFISWLDFSVNIYKVFLAEVKKELNYMDYGYV